MFRGIGNKLLPALAITGQLKKQEAEVISEQLEAVELAARAAAPVPAEGPYYNRLARNQLRTRQTRHRVSRNRKFHEKRHNPYDEHDGITCAQPRLTHATVANKGVHFMYNPLLQKLLWSSGAMDASRELNARYPSAKLVATGPNQYEVLS